MKFYVKKYQELIKSTYNYPCFILNSITWDDYGYKTSFILRYYKERHKQTEIGTVKIMDLDNEVNEGQTILPSEFENLPDKFCSLGSYITYYEKFIEIENDVDVLTCLDALNDAASMPGIREQFEETNGFRASLIREREARMALLLGERIIKKLPIDSKIDFSFTTKLNGALNDHSVNFKFDKNELLQQRVFAIVGKNGTGKTQFLSNLANALSFSRTDIKSKNSKGFIKIEEYETGKFDTDIGPPFGKVISVSYSLFDTFKRPKPSKRFSYIYCGLRNENDEIDKVILRTRHLESLKQINKKRIGDVWVEVLSKFVNLKELGYQYNDWPYIVENIDEIESSKILSLSSGHSMLVYTITELIANLSENSLVLFDEPENHLHPNAIANLINSINYLMKRFDSFAIIATHSPIVIQEIPSSNVYVFEREGNSASTWPLDIESYGENLTVITKHIFETNEIVDGYKQYLKNISLTKSFEEINDLFDNKLSLNAKIYLSSLYPNQ